MGIQSVRNIRRAFSGAKASHVSLGGGGKAVRGSGNEPSTFLSLASWKLAPISPRAKRTQIKKKKKEKKIVWGHRPPRNILKSKDLYPSSFG